MKESEWKGRNPLLRLSRFIQTLASPGPPEEWQALGTCNALPLKEGGFGPLDVHGALLDGDAPQHGGLREGGWRGEGTDVREWGGIGAGGSRSLGTPFTSGVSKESRYLSSESCFLAKYPPGT